MINYSIDASVYAYPFHGGVYDVKEIESYYDIIKNLNSLIFSKQPQQYRKYFLFEKDMKLIIKNSSLDLTKQNISQLDQILKSNGSWRKMQEAQYFFDMIISKTPTSKKSKYIMFEKWFNIKNIVFKPGKYPLLPDEVNKKINNKELKKIQ